jgi:hypothetical protein
MNPIKTLLASCLATLTFTAVPASAQSAAQPAP